MPDETPVIPVNALTAAVETAAPLAEVAEAALENVAAVPNKY